MCAGDAKSMGLACPSCGADKSPVGQEVRCADCYDSYGFVEGKKNPALSHH